MSPTGSTFPDAMELALKNPATVRRTAASIASLTLAATLASSVLAHAQDNDAEASSASDVVAGSSRSPLSGGSSIDVALSSVDAIGSSEFPVPEDLVEVNDAYPRPFSESYDKPAIADIEKEDRPGVDRWFVESPAMARTVELQVLPAADPDEPSPILFLLDGLSAPRNSGWVSHADLEGAFVGDNVTVVMPTEARGSMFVDWHNDDPGLGRNKWESLIATELPPLLAEEVPNHNGKFGVGGLSMGASGAVALANANPEVFDAVFGISGCYSTTSPAGRMMAHGTVESRGGDSANLYGPDSSGLRERYDVVNRPEGLRDMEVYLSATTGAVSAGDEEHYGDDALGMALGVILEQGANSCTRDLDAAMGRAGMDHQEVVFLDEGAHDWAMFAAQLAPAWEHIKDGLY